MGTCFEFDREVMAVCLEASDQEDVLKKMAQKLYNADYVLETYSEAIILRERSFPTGLPTGINGVAIPHTDVCHVKAPMIAVGTLKTPVEFKSMGGLEETVPVKIIFMLAMNSGDNQVRLLSQLMQVIQDQHLLEQLAAAKSVSDLVKLLNGKIHL